MLLADQKLNAPYAHRSPGQAQTDDVAEYVAPVRWFTSKPKTSASCEKCMFANQNSACKLRQEFTLDRVATHFGVAGEDS